MKIDDLASSIAQELMEYSDEVAAGIKADVRRTAKECAAEIRAKSPKATGDYAKGWKVRTAFESDSDIRVTVFNKTDGSLTHLLEDGHAKATGGRVEGKPHIRPAEQAATEKLGKRVKVTVGTR